MGRDLQKKKNRSSRPRIRQRTKSKKRFQPHGSKVVAENWDDSKTVSQNYQNLGLSSKLGGRAGGVEKNAAAPTDPKHAARQAAYAAAEVRVERDPKTGEILHVVGSNKGRPNPLNDILNDLSDSEAEDAEPAGSGSKDVHAAGVVRELEEEASYEAEVRPRHQSVREQEWIERLVARHGDDYVRMAMDRKLNPFQQNPGELRKRIAKWRESRGS